MTVITPTPRIRQATITDLEALIPLYHHYRAFYGFLQDDVGVHRFLADRLTKQDTTLYVAMVRPTNAVEQLAGFIHIFSSFSIYTLSPYYVLNDLFVAEDSRKQGIGALLMDRAKQYCTDNEGRGLILETGIKNYDAQSLYLKSGFKPMSDVVFMGWEAPS